MRVPQADDVTKIADLPLAVAEGVNTPEAISERYQFDRRQALYYLEAAEMLGLLNRRRNRCVLSSLGRRYVALTPPHRHEFLARRMLSLPVIAQVVQDLLVSPLHHLTREQVDSLAASSKAGISGSTIGRRVQSIFSWLTWLGEETGMFRVSKDSVTIANRR